MLASKFLAAAAPTLRPLSTLTSTSTLSKLAIVVKPPSGWQTSWRGMASRRARMAMNEGQAGGQTGTRQTIKERLMAPTSGTPFKIGAIGVAAASGLGLGALCFYGLGLGKQAGAIDRMGIWPEHVKKRIQTTYMYFGGGLLITAATAAACFRSPAIMNLVTRNGMLAIVGTMVLLIGSGAVVRSIPYKPGFGMKQMAWMGHVGIVGALLAPLCYMGGPLLLQAAYYTAGVVGGLSLVAMCAPSEKFLKMGGVLGMGMGAVFLASIGSAFFAPTSALGAGLYSISVYGGLVIFGGLLLYDTQRIIKAAEQDNYYSATPYDPISHSMAIYMDAINIFIRIAMILASGGGRRK